MNANDEQHEVIYRVSFSSILMEDEIKQFEAEMRDLAAKSDSGNLAIDFSKTFHLSSRALGILVAVHKELEARGGKIVLFGANPAIQRVMEVTQLDTLISVVPDETQAIGRLRTSSGLIAD